MKNEYYASSQEESAILREEAAGSLRNDQRWVNGRVVTVGRTRRGTTGVRLSYNKLTGERAHCWFPNPERFEAAFAKTKAENPGHEFHEVVETSFSVERYKIGKPRPAGYKARLA